MLVKRTNVKVFTIKFVGTRPSPYKKKNLPGRGLIKVGKHWFKACRRTLLQFLPWRNAHNPVQNYLSVYFCHRTFYRL